MAYSTIDKSSLHFNPIIYTGNGGTQALTGVGFQPDWVWVKSRDVAKDHMLFDVVRGVQKSIRTNQNIVEDTSSGYLTAFGTDGFTLGGNGKTNGNGNTFVAWNWKAGNSQGSSNTAGSINTTYTSVNTTAGFSISTYTGTAATATIGHGLGVVPKMIITKRISGGNEDWGVYHASVGATKYLKLNAEDAEGSSSGVWNDTAPTNQVFSVGSSSLTNGSGTYVAYCFAEKKGYSKFGSYTGNGNANGTFVYTGFKPSWILIKTTDLAGNNWQMYDNKREGYNSQNDLLRANSNNAEGNGTDPIDILSNGFKMYNTAGSANQSGGTYIYMAFAAEPLVANVGQSIPATAR